MVACGSYRSSRRARRSAGSWRPSTCPPSLPALLRPGRRRRSRSSSCEPRVRGPQIDDRSQTPPTRPRGRVYPASNRIALRAGVKPTVGNSRAVSTITKRRWTRKRAGNAPKQQSPACPIPPRGSQNAADISYARLQGSTSHKRMGIPQSRHPHGRTNPVRTALMNLHHVAGRAGAAAHGLRIEITTARWHRRRDHELSPSGLVPWPSVRPRGAVSHPTAGCALTRPLNLQSQLMGYNDLDDLRPPWPPKNTRLPRVG